MWLYFRVFLRAQGSVQSTCPHDIAREATFHVGIYWQYGGYHICLYGASQLHSFCFVFCDTGSCACILCYFILPRGVCWDEISFIFRCLLRDEMLWKVMLASASYDKPCIFVPFFTSKIVSLIDEKLEMMRDIADLQHYIL